MLFHPVPYSSTSQTNRSTDSSVSLRLDQIPMRTPFVIDTIESINPSTNNITSDLNETPDLSKYLESLGFLPNEQVELLSCAPFSGDPIIVRVGLSKFALRRAEAAYIKVKPL